MSETTVIKNGRIIDGSGRPGFIGDIAIKDGKIIAIATELDDGDITLDATDRVVTPGFIDPHTHYDAQICWDQTLTSSSAHGVTTVVMGNCGVGIAPCKPESRDITAHDLVNVEAIPYDVLKAGITWDWQSYPEFMQAAINRGTGINLGFLLPLSALRHYVMGEPALERAATPDEISEMATLLKEAMDAGAMGFSFTVLKQHIGFEGRPLCCRNASREELAAFAHVLRDGGRGLIQVACGSAAGELDEAGYDLIDFLLTESHRPVTWAFLLVPPENPSVVGATLEKVNDLYARGAVPQVSCRPFMTQLELSKPFLFADRESFHKIINLPREQQKLAYRDEAFRKAARDELDNSPGVFGNGWGRVELQEFSNPELEQFTGRSVADIAKEQGKHPLDVFLDLALDYDYDLRYMYDIANIDETWVKHLITDKRTLIGVSDSGAHVDQLCDAGYATWLLGTWVRDRKALTMEHAVRRITLDQAEFLGLPDRGRLAVGAAADVVILDPKTVGSDRFASPQFDLPGGARRLVAAARGIDTVIVNGQIAVQNNEATGNLAGEQVRPESMT
ncbi:MAG: amidohydrolase [Gammaproteobacteria bacterium]|nr:MAG: amidohydrolase [Gammaproteobacteria bacterium]